MAAMLGWFNDASTCASRVNRQTVVVVRERIRKHLDGDIASQLGIGGAVNRSHPALAELGGYFVVGDARWRNHQDGVRIIPLG